MLRYVAGVLRYVAGVLRYVAGVLRGTFLLQGMCSSS